MKKYERLLKLTPEEFGFLRDWLADGQIDLFESGRSILKKMENADLVISKGDDDKFKCINTIEEEPKKEIKPVKLKEKEAIAYCDGSFNEKTRTYGYGVVLQVGNDVYEFKDAEDNIEKASMRNIAGEIDGARRAVTEAVNKGCTKLKLYFDYTGIEFWATGKWKTNKFYTKEYADFMKSQKIKIEFHHVKGHTGVEGNERCDKLAREAVGL